MMDMGARQNETKSINLLLARQQLASQIWHWQAGQALLVAVFPAIFALVLIFTSFPRPWAILLPLAMAVIDPWVIDRKIKELTLEQARLAEKFDCQVFELDWDKFIAGTKPSDYEVEVIALRQKGADLSKLRDWYPLHQGLTPYEAVLRSQSAMVLYDLELRKSYFRFLTLFAITFFPAIFVLGFVSNPNLQDFVVLLAPIIPIAGWTTRELIRASDAKAKNYELYKQISGQLSEAAPSSDVARKTVLRSTQNAIFLKRSRFPWVPIFYNRRRSELEALITKSVSRAASEPEAAAPVA